MKKLEVLFLSIALTLLVCGHLQAQQNSNYLYTVGNQPFSTQIPIENGFINVNNGDIHIEIPLAQNAQRGSIQLNERLVYDSRIWKIVQNGGYSWSPTNVPNSMGGWTFQSGIGAGSLQQIGEGSINVRCDDNANGRPVYYTGYGWTEPSGTYHRFNAQWQAYPKICEQGTDVPEQQSGSAIDSSGYTIQLSGSQYGNPNSIQVFDRAGNQVYPTLQDSNGNYMSTDANGNLVDTLGRTPVLSSTNGNLIYYDVLGINGIRNRYTVTTQAVSYHTAFNENQVTEASGSFTAIQSLTLPDGTSYAFAYDSGSGSGNYGELTSVTLPTGGAIQYGYTNFLDSYQNQNRWIQTRVKDGGTTTFTPATISNCTSSTGCQEKVTVTSPTGNDTVYTFALDKGSYANASSWNTGVGVYQGSSAGGGTQLASSSTTYNYATNYISVAPNNSQPYQVPNIVTTSNTLVDVGLATQNQTTLDYSGVNPVSVKQWDYYSGSSAPSSPTRETDYSYYGVNGGSRTSKVVVNNSSGNTLSSVSYGYDEVTPAAAPGGLSHYTAVSTNVRGNMTSVHQWSNTSNTTLNSTMTYDSAGALITSASPLGTTKYGYDPTDTFTMSTGLPTPSSGVALTTSTGYDPSTGIVTSSTDANNQITTYKNFDSLNRAQEIDTPDGATTALTYTPTSASIAASNSSTGWTIKATDTFGRPNRLSVATGVASNPWYMQDTCYNAAGQVSFKSYRFQGLLSLPQVCSGSGDSYLYDGLGRVARITHADGSLIQYNYAGRATQTTDENGVRRIVQSDGFGRPTIVCELSSNSSMPNSGSPVACGTDLPGTGFVTSYSYNDAAFSTTVTQGAQTRTFVTDSLGRQVSAQEPESGTASYTYAYNQTGLLVNRTKPRANQTNAGVVTTTQTQYDALSRPISVTYNDGTGAKTYSYDVPYPGTSSTNVKGRLAQQYAATSSVGPASEAFSYDPMGRVNGTFTCFPSTCGKSATTQNYTYDFAGRVLSASDGAGETANYTYTPAGELLSITGPQGAPFPDTLLSNVANGPNGPTSYQLGNGLYNVNRYDTLGRRNGGWVCSGSSSPYCSGGTQLYGFTLTANGGRVNQACDTVLGSCGSMGYDDFNRLNSSSSTSGTARSVVWTYDRYGNRWSQTPTPSGYAQQASYNSGNNQAVGFQYDAAGNLLNDTVHSYSYDAEGNMIAVDGGSTAKYFYDGSNHRVRTEIGSLQFELLFNLGGQKVAIFNAATGAVLEEDTHLGERPLALLQGSTLYFEHQDWLGTERMLTDASGKTAGTYGSLPFGDGFSDNGTDLDPYHFAGLDHDYESGLDHAQYREYTAPGGRWLSPDPYSGSYDASSPQSFNRYAYALNSPLSLADPSGQIACEATAGIILATGGPVGPEGAGIACGIEYAAAAAIDIFKLLGLFSGPSFHGSLKPRPNAQPFDEHNIYFSHGSIAAALGLPDESCEFGACGGGMGFQQGSTPDSPNHGFLYTVASIAELFGTGFPYDDWTDSNHRLFGTHYCGPGGGGGVTSRPADSLCQAHDACLDGAHLTWEDETKSLPADQAATMQSCNQTLCDAAGKSSAPSAAIINAFFHGYGNYTCHF